MNLYIVIDNTRNITHGYVAAKNISEVAIQYPKARSICFEGVILKPISN